ncbi:fatty acid cis/trans isomerase [Ruegeria meonggei]|uniref:Fatty acid cis/trans isomerase (CTI) n=1 Tax=Ruegeria meonggei TaxID=1446476 RepID=A0A1X6YVQ2_9RHOB|nr:fatty acid cis/trans isomerase [Ruegeria meonggei]SLN32556.1 Fatty acid cis/trans isomerase (CTI) [Ruegeria meonggei]
MQKARSLRRSMVSVLIAFACAAPHWAEAQSDPSVASATNADWAEVKEIMDRRCVVCHSCYDAPCQLKLTSPAGLLRGASKQAVYHSQRLEDAPLTRLGVDAQSLPQWRALGFHSVTQNVETDPSLLERYLNLGRLNPMPENAPVPAALDLTTDRPLACPTPDEFDAYRDSNPLAGMPYATAPLEDHAHQTLVAWARSGAPLPSDPPNVPDDIQAQITEWEAFLNGKNMRPQLMSRYIYEHLFLARLHFQGDDPRRFFQLVRSTTPPGEKIGIIATRRPFDAPGVNPFYYRLQQIDETIVHKEHLVYEIGPDRMARFQTLFLDPGWTLATAPPYGDAEGGNPFSTFASMPARSRYQFLLDDALFFVRSFIRGPVCHGQTAVDVIEDRFWVSFLDPDADLSITDPAFLQDGAVHLELPVSGVDGGALGDLQGFSHANQVRYLEFRDARYRDSAAHTEGFDYDAIWDGDGTNPNALITVFRHFDNAAAMTGFHGDIPETAWVIDYPIFERIYYDLVAGFDVFGRVEHQLSTRLYMDELRMESEDTFLSFMPKAARQQIHKKWYQGTLAEIHTYWHHRHVDASFPTGIGFETSTPKQEFLLTLLARGNGLWSVSDPINRCADADCSQSQTQLALRALANQRGDWVRYLPDLSVLVVEDSGGAADVFSLAHDKAHTNVAFLFDEAARRDPETDVLTILPGLAGSYPNFFFKVRQDELTAFVQDLKAVGSQSDFMEVVANHGVRRTSPEFWPLSDRIHEIFIQRNPVHAGILDLNRYKDPKSADDPT